MSQNTSFTLETQEKGSTKMVLNMSYPLETHNVIHILETQQECGYTKTLGDLNLSM